jgi:5-methylcytosine-specific restriction endonuclease McrA
LLRALEAVRDAHWQEPRGSAEPRPARQASNAEALVALAEAALAHSDGSRPRGERYQVVVHTDEAVLAHDGEGACELEDGSALASETARRIACDASLVRDGRRTRTIPRALRRALRRRDRACCFPGCENRRFLDAHHIDHWAKGGETTLENLLLLCRRHHRAVDEGGYSVDPQGRFFYPWGEPLPAVPQLPRGHPDGLVGRNRDCDIDADTCESGTGDPLDFGEVVDALLAIDRRAARAGAAYAAAATVSS